MSVRVKICGIRTLADAQMAVAAGADALGFIFYPTSPRFVQPEKVAEINRLVDLLKLDKATTDKWLEKAGVENFSEFNQEQAAKIIENLQSKIK